MNTHLRNILVALLGLVVIGAAWTFLKADRAVRTAEAPAGTASSTDATTTVTAPGAGVTSVKIALLDYEGTSGGKERGCDRVVLVDRPVATTTAPLTAALRALFAYDGIDEIGAHATFIPRTRDTLSFDRAEVQDGTARIYLVGSLSGLAGVCDDPRAKIQIEETALQFPTVQRVELYLDGARTELQPSQKGD